MHLDWLAADVTSAYIQAYTKEMVYTITSPEFGKYQGRILLIDKALWATNIRYGMAQ